MSSISAQGVVERASAELSKRINGLGLRTGKHHRQNTESNNSSSTPTTAATVKASVMERVTNVFCGGGSNNAPLNPPEKPSRLLPTRQTQQILQVTKPGAQMSTANGNVGSVGGRIGHLGYYQQHPGHHGGLHHGHLHQGHMVHGPLQAPMPVITSWEQLILDERFLTKFFLYFSATERRILAQVCSRWKDILYRSPRYWTGLVPVLHCRELRSSTPNERARLYSSLLRRGFHAVCLLGAVDEDALDLVHSFPLAAKQVHSLSLRCSSVSDRGLEALLDHLQVSICTYIIKFNTGGIR